jgi:hypothetical protein
MKDKEEKPITTNYDEMKYLKLKREEFEKMIDEIRQTKEKEE